jgi:hypothetical protein
MIHWTNLSVEISINALLSALTSDVLFLMTMHIFAVENMVNYPAEIIWRAK